MGRYTLIQSGDFNAAENVGALAGDVKREGIVNGLELSNLDTAAPSIDVAAGKTVHIVPTQVAEATLDDGSTVSEQRDQVQLVAHVDSQTVSLTDGTVNELFLDPQVSADDSPQIEVVTSGTPPSNAVKIGEVDTGADTVSGQFNKIEPDGTLSFPDGDSANAALSSLPSGVTVIDRTNGVRISSGGISVDTLEATDSITDPKGNTVTSLSDPVRVTEEASTFTESDVTVSNNNTTVSNGSVALLGELIANFEDGDITTKSTNWDGFKGDTLSLSAQTNTVLSGSFSAELSASAGENLTVTTTRDSGTDSNLLLKFQISSPASTVGEAVKFSFYDSSGSILDEIFWTTTSSGNEGEVKTSNSGNQILSSWTSGKTYDIELRWDFANDQYDVIIDGTNEGTFNFFGGRSDFGELDFALDNTDTTFSRSIFFDDISEDDAKTNGDVLVAFGSGSPADIESYDLATFQRTLDGETVTIDVEDSNGNVLKSDISKDTDISGIATSTDVQLRANLSRNDTANNPTVDYLARRFTR